MFASRWLFAMGRWEQRSWTMPADAEGKNEIGVIMATSERSKGTDSRVDRSTTSDGTVVITKIIGETNYIWLSEDGQEGERVAIDELPDYFARKDPGFKALMDKINSDPAFRQVILADTDESRQAVREFVESLTVEGEDSE